MMCTITGAANRVPMCVRVCQQFHQGGAPAGCALYAQQCNEPSPTASHVETCGQLKSMVHVPTISFRLPGCS